MPIMNRLCPLYLLVALMLGAATPSVLAQPSLEQTFTNPPQEARPLMIWQWMDGVVSREGITADLEAYQQAGIGGVQQFLVGGPMQGVICDTTNAIGTESWKRLMRHAISECQRLGLTFGTHNCPGWSSSAHPSVEPRYSMQKLVWTTVDFTAPAAGASIALPQQPEVDPRWNYYEDIAVFLLPADSLFRLEDVKVLRTSDFPLRLKNTTGRLLRLGHTTNGKTNGSTAPYGGVGLECDKMSREAVRRYWASYPQLLLDVAGNAAGSTFQRLEIDSYEAGGQEWTPLMAAEFQRRCGYDMLLWLPVLAGFTVESADRTKHFRSDYAKVGQQLFAENYYGYMGELAARHGLHLLYQPYGTNSSKPFNPINTELIARQLPNDYFCTEFWYRPTNWGWPSVPRHTAVAHKLGLQRIFAESFTCWPMHAWQEDPASLKVMADRAFCMGVNSLMLHAGAQNPWPQAVPGMTFGKWGSWFTPGQTWWRSGGARLLFLYFARCQALLQRGQWVDDYLSKSPSLTSDSKLLQWTHRREAEADVYFLSNPQDTVLTTTVVLATKGRVPELWYPDTGSSEQAVAWSASGGQTRLLLSLQPHESLFVVLRHAAVDEGPGLSFPSPVRLAELPVDGPWTLSFPAGWGAPSSVVLNALTPWNEHADEGVRYFSGTASYTVDFRLKRLDKSARYVLSLGEVKNLARVYINEREVAHLWKPPFSCDVTGSLRKGRNTLRIEVTNLWPNRMIGDEQWPDDVEWDTHFIYDYAPGKPEVGSFMKTVPQWLREGTLRPEPRRKTVVSFKYFRKDSPLLPSGLLGPVSIKVYRP